MKTYVGVVRVKDYNLSSRIGHNLSLVQFKNPSSNKYIYSNNKQ